MWSVGVAAEDTLAAVRRTLLRAVPVSSSPRLAALVVPLPFVMPGKQGKKTGRRLPSFLREKRGGGGEEEKNSYGSVGVGVYGSVGVVSLC